MSEVLNLSHLKQLLEKCGPETWTAVIEGRDQESGDSFIMVGSEGGSRKADLYVFQDAIPAEANWLDLMAAARNALPLLIAEIERLTEKLEN